MIQLAHSPIWFFSIDAAIDVFSAAVLALIALMSLRYYRLVHEKNYLWFTFAYLSLAVSFVFVAIVQYLLRAFYVEKLSDGLISIAGEELAEHTNLIYGAFFSYAFLFLLGLYILYAIGKQQPKMNHAIFTILLFITATFAGPYHAVFHSITALFLILLSIDYWKHHREQPRLSTKLVALSFSTLAFSEVLFIVLSRYTAIYAIVMLIQLAAFITLLLSFLFINYGKKKIIARHHA